MFPWVSISDTKISRNGLSAEPKSYVLEISGTISLVIINSPLIPLISAVDKEFVKKEPSIFTLVELELEFEFEFDDGSFWIFNVWIFIWFELLPKLAFAVSPGRPVTVTLLLIESP